MGCAGELHALHGAGGDILERDAAATEQVGRAGEDLQACDTAIGERAAEACILWPYAMFGPDMGGDGRGRFIAVGMGVDAGRGIVAEMAVDVDDAGGDIFAGAVEHGDVGGDRRVRAADRRDLAVRQEDDAIVDAAALPVEDGRAANGGGGAGIGFVGGRIRVFGFGRAALGGGRGILVFLRAGGAGHPGQQGGDQQRRCAFSHGLFSEAIRSRCIRRLI